MVDRLSIVFNIAV